jgi:hypothetical protein
MNSSMIGRETGADLVIIEIMIISCADCSISDASLSATQPPYSDRFGTGWIFPIESAA